MNLEVIARILAPFVEEALPGGGIDMSISRWQKPGRGYGGIFPDQPDVRYMHALVDLLYRVDGLLPGRGYGELADRQVGFMAAFTRAEHPTWLQGTTLQCLGFHRRRHGGTEEFSADARRIVAWVRQRKVEIDAGEVCFVHFPCGYGALNARDAGWTNDLSIFGSGLVLAYEVTGDTTMIEEAISFAEYFVRPWRAGSLGPDGYWHAGTWRDELGCWCIGPLHGAGFESTDAYADETALVFSAFSCIDYLGRLYHHRPDPRFLDCCRQAAAWTFDHCQFEDGAVGVCGRDDKWLGSTGYATSLILMLRDMLKDQPFPRSLLASAQRAAHYLRAHLPQAELDGCGVEWVTHTTLADPLVNVGWMWLNAALGFVDSERLAPEAIRPDENKDKKE